MDFRLFPSRLTNHIAMLITKVAFSILEKKSKIVLVHLSILLKNRVRLKIPLDFLVCMGTYLNSIQ